MRRVYITFGGAAYDEALEKQRHGVCQHLNITTAHERNGRWFVYDDKWLTEHPFYEQNRWLFIHPDALNPQNTHPRGFGWFAWKPLIMLDALARLDSGDVVLFTDADTYPIADFSMLYDECKRIGGVMLFNSIGCCHANWCKRDTFIVMGQDNDVWRFRDHACARFMLFEAGVWKARQLLMEWLTYCVNPLANTMDPSQIHSGPARTEEGEPIPAREYPDLHEPRCEQAILTNLAHKYGIKLYREACQAGASQPEDKDLYGQVFVQEDAAGEKRDLSGSRFRNVEGWR